MGESTINTTPFLSSTVKIIFILNTMWGLYKYYTLAQSQTPGVTSGLPSSVESSNTALAVVSWLVDIIASINPLGLLKLFWIYIMQNPTPLLYDVLNTFVLVPIGLIVTFYELNWAWSKVPTVSGEV